MSELGNAAAGAGNNGDAGGAPGASGGNSPGGSPGGAPAGDPGTGGSGQANTGGGAPAGGAAPGGQSGASWINDLPPELRDDVSIKGYKTPGDLAKAYVHAQKLIGADKIPIPGKQATEEDWGNVYAKLGRPEAPDKYELKLADGVTPEEMAPVREVAHKLGLNSRQLQGLYDMQVQRETQAAKAQEESYNKLVETKLGELKSEWQGNTYQENLQQAGRALQNVFGKDAVEWANKSGAGNDPQFIKMMHKVASLVSEDVIKGEGGVSYGESRSNIQSKIDSMYADPKGPYLNEKHPGHASAQMEMQGLYQMLNKK